MRIVRDFDCHERIFSQNARAESAYFELFRIGVAGKEGVGTVNLFGEDDARELVRHGQRGKRKPLFCGALQKFRESGRVAAKENKLSRATIAQIAKPASKLCRSELFSGGVQH